MYVVYRTMFLEFYLIIQINIKGVVHGVSLVEDNFDPGNPKNSFPPIIV